MEKELLTLQHNALGTQMRVILPRDNLLQLHQFGDISSASALPVLRQ
jgi:hypothetical protein